MCHAWKEPSSSVSKLQTLILGHSADTGWISTGPMMIGPRPGGLGGDFCTHTKHYIERSSTSTFPALHVCHRFSKIPRFRRSRIQNTSGSCLGSPAPRFSPAVSYVRHCTARHVQSEHHRRSARESGCAPRSKTASSAPLRHHPLWSLQC